MISDDDIIMMCAVPVWALPQKGVARHLISGGGEAEGRSTLAIITPARGDQCGHQSARRGGRGMKRKAEASTAVGAGAARKAQDRRAVAQRIQALIREACRMRDVAAGVRAFHAMRGDGDGEGEGGEDTVVSVSGKQFASLCALCGGLIARKERPGAAGKEEDGNRREGEGKEGKDGEDHKEEDKTAPKETMMEMYAFAKERGMGLSEAAYTAFIRVLCDAGELARAQELLAELRDSGDDPTRLRTFSPILVGLCARGQVAEVDALLALMQEDEVSLGEHEHVALLGLAARTGDADRFYKQLDAMADDFPLPTCGAELWPVLEKWFAARRGDSSSSSSSSSNSSSGSCDADEGSRARWRVIRVPAPPAQDGGVSVPPCADTDLVGPSGSTGGSTTVRLRAVELPDAVRRSMLESMVGIATRSENKAGRFAKFITWVERSIGFQSSGPEYRFAELLNGNQELAGQQDSMPAPKTAEEEEKQEGEEHTAASAAAVAAQTEAEAEAEADTEANAEDDVRTEMEPAEVRRPQPPDVIIDGANVGFFGQSNSKNKPSSILFDQLDAMVRQLRDTLGKSVLLVLHCRHLFPDRLSAADAAIVRGWDEAHILYRTPSGSNDDWYWEYAALAAGPLTQVVTNDEMRDHHFNLLSERAFSRWRERHQVRFDIDRDGSITLFPPKQYSLCMHRTNEACFFPAKDKPDEILCVVRDR